MTAVASRAPSTNPSPLPRWRAALRVETDLQMNAILGSGVIAVIVMVLAWAGLIRLGFIPIILALQTPVMLAQGDSEAARRFRAQLGLSRADRVRARTLLVCLVQAGLAALAALTLLLDRTGAPPTPGGPMARWHDLGALAVPVPTGALWADVLCWLPACVLAHAWMGREALRTGGLLVSLGSFGAFVATYGLPLLVVMVLVQVPGLLPQDGPLSPWSTFEGPGSPFFQILVGAVILVLGLLLLAWRSRAWARSA